MKQPVVPRPRRFVFNEKYFTYVRKKPNFEFRKTITPATSTLFCEMKVHWMFLRAMGLLPYSENKKTGNCFAFFEEVEETVYMYNLRISGFPGEVTFSFLSLPAGYSLLVYIATTVFNFIDIREMINLNIKAKPFEYKVINYLHTIQALSIFTIPVIFWKDTKLFVEYIERWTKFDVSDEVYNVVSLDVLLFNVNFGILHRESVDIYLCECLLNTVRYVPAMYIFTYPISSLKVWDMNSLSSVL